jgi:hypothetical protein
MTTSLTLVAQQVALELATYFAATPSQRVYFTERELEDTEVILAIVVPGTVKSNLLSHGRKRKESITIDICLRKNIGHFGHDPVQKTAAIDALFEILEDMGSHFEFRRLATPGITAHCIAVQLRYPYVIEDLENWSQYTGIATLNVVVQRS